jgi:hypothetical protein
MWNFHPDVVVQTFVKFHPGRSFTRQELVEYDLQLFNANDAFLAAALRERGILNPTPFDKSKVLQIATCSPGDWDAAVRYAAGAYKHALDTVVIG